MEGGRAEENPLGSSLRTGDHASRLAAAERRLEAQAEQIATMLDGTGNPAALMARLGPPPPIGVSARGRGCA